MCCSARRALLVCRAAHHNVSDKEYDALAAAHDIYRKTLTSNRIALYPSTIGEVVMDLGRGTSRKDAAHFDTITRWRIVEGRYYVHSSFACVGKATFDPIRLDMCALLLQRHVLLPSRRVPVVILFMSTWRAARACVRLCLLCVWTRANSCTTEVNDRVSLVQPQQHSWRPRGSAQLRTCSRRCTVATSGCSCPSAHVRGGCQAARHARAGPHHPNCGARFRLRAPRCDGRLIRQLWRCRHPGLPPSWSSGSLRASARAR